MKMKSKKFSRDREGKIKKIVDTFWDLVEKTGYDDASTNKIAKRVGISIGTVYRYFPEGKVDIIRTAFEDLTKEFVNPEDIATMDPSRFVPYLQEFVSGYLKSHEEHAKHNAAIDQAILTSKSLKKDHEMMVKDYMMDLAKKIQALSPAYKEIPTSALAESYYIVYNTLDAIVHRHLHACSFFDEEEHLVNFLVKLLAFIIASRQEGSM